MILIHLFFILVALLSPLSLSSPVAPFPRHRKLHSHRLSPRHVFDLPYSRDRSQPTIAPSNPQVTALPDEEVPTITIVDPPVGPTLTLEVSAPSSSLTIASASKPTSNIVISPTEAKVTTQPQELLLSVLPNILLFGGSYRFTFSSWASDSGLLIVGLVCVTLSAHCKALLTVYHMTVRLTHIDTLHRHQECPISVRATAAKSKLCVSTDFTFTANSRCFSSRAGCSSSPVHSVSFKWVRLTRRVTS
jgi:hypothetical protein